MGTPASDLPHGTVTFVFTDIEGSTDLARRHGANFGRVRSEHRRVLREAFGRYGGHEIDTAGDGFFVAFDRAGDAVAAAIAAQRAVAGLEVRVRMGLHSAEPYLDEEGYVGVGVHRAPRGSAPRDTAVRSCSRTRRRGSSKISALRECSSRISASIG